MRKVFALFGTITMKGIEKINTDMSTLDKKLSDMSKQFGKQGRKLQTIGRNLTTHITLPLAAASGAVIKFGADFDKAMTQSTAIMGKDGKIFNDQMREIARTIAKETTISAKEAASAYYYLASAGKSAEQSMALLPKVAKFAEAGQFDLATATDLLTDAQSALGLATKDVVQDEINMVRVSDVLVKANTLANASVQQFSESLTNRAAAALRMVNKDMEEGVAVLAAFADQGVKGTEAGTQFSIVMRDLQSKAIKNKDAFIKYKVAVYDASGQMRNIADIISDLEKALSGMSDQQKKATLLTMGFTDKSMASMLTLLGTSDAIREYESQLRNAAGTTEEVASKQLESFWAKIEIIKNSLIDLAISVSEDLLPIIEKQLLPIVREWIKWFQKLIGFFNGLSTAEKDFIVGITATIAVLGPFLMIGGKILVFLGSLRAAILAVTAAMATNPFLAAMSGLLLLGTAIAGLITKYDGLKKSHIDTVKTMEEKSAVDKFKEDAEEMIIAKKEWLKYEKDHIKILEKMAPGVDALIERNKKLTKEIKGNTAEKIKAIEAMYNELTHFVNVDEWAKKYGSTQKQITDDKKKQVDMTKWQVEADVAEVEANEAALQETNKWMIYRQKAAKVEKDANKEALDNTNRMLKYKQKANEITAEENTKRSKEYNEDVQKNVERWQQRISFTGAAAEQIGNITTSLFNREQQAIDKTYEKDRERIENSLMDQEEKDAALLALEEKYNEDSNKIKKKQAIADKAMALFQIAINTAIAISEVLGKPWLIAGVVALGAAQAAAVALEPIPLKKGGFLPGSEYGTMALLGEQGTKELVLPLETGIKQLTSGIVDQIGLMVNPNTNQPKESLQGNINSNSQLVLNIGTFYGEEQWVKELTRKIIPVINSENQRKALSY